MSTPRARNGATVGHLDPVWGPLERVVGLQLAGSFMWMHEVQLTDGTRIHAYKHRFSRRYLHLTPDGQSFRFEAPSRYRPSNLRADIRSVFMLWEDTLPNGIADMNVFERYAVEAALELADDEHGTAEPDPDVDEWRRDGLGETHELAKIATWTDVMPDPPVGVDESAADPDPMAPF